jgi:hypothetical protein
MEYYADISTEQFERIRDHETSDLILDRSLACRITGKDADPLFTQGDGLKLYHPSEYPEALRVLVCSLGEAPDSDSVLIHISLEEWMMSFPDDSSGGSKGLGGIL